MSEKVTAAMEAMQSSKWDAALELIKQLSPADLVETQENGYTVFSEMLKYGYATEEVSPILAKLTPEQLSPQLDKNDAYATIGFPYHQALDVVIAKCGSPEVLKAVTAKTTTSALITYAKRFDTKNGTRETTKHFEPTKETLEKRAQTGDRLAETYLAIRKRNEANLKSPSFAKTSRKWDSGRS
jgi:hypothetical protein